MITIQGYQLPPCIWEDIVNALFIQNTQWQEIQINAKKDATYTNSFQEKSVV